MLVQGVFLSVANLVKLACSQGKGTVLSSPFLAPTHNVDVTEAVANFGGLSKTEVVGYAAKDNLSHLLSIYRIKPVQKPSGFS